MPDSDNRKYVYDKKILVNNINKKLKEQRLKPADIVRADIAPQSRVSVCLDIDKKDSFTISQLVSLSGFLGVSLDELLGLNAFKNDEFTRTTLADICNMLFQIDDICGLNVVSFNDISFELGKMNEFLSEWEKVKETTSSMGDIGKELLTAWKEKKIRQYTEYKLPYHSCAGLVKA